MAIEVLLPALSPTMTEGTLAKWLKKEGERVRAGDVIAEVETDKATMEIEAIDDGTLASILIKEGTENIPINTPIGIISEEGSNLETQTKPLNEKSGIVAENEKKVSRKPLENSVPQVPEEATLGVTGDPKKRIFVSPLAKRMAFQEKLDLSTMRGTGPGGRIVKADILKILMGRPQSATSIVEPAQPVSDGRSSEIIETMSSQTIQNTNMRKVIAERLTESKTTIPHFYMTIGIEIDKLLEVKDELNNEERAPQLSINDFFIRATALALKSLPSANATWGKQETLQHKRVDIAVAVAVDGGLITPVIKDAANKGLETISNEMKDLARRAREGKLLPEEYQGGTFSISNLGMYGVREFAAVINPPQAGILAIGAAVEKPVVKNSAISIATSLDCTLSCDHRVIDGAIGAKLLSIIKKLTENPLTMLL